MKRELVEARLFTDDCCDEIYSYEEYKLYCEDMEKELFSDNSDQYWDWVRDQEEFWWEELMDALEIRCSFPCIITRSCGTWRGRREICPIYMDNVKDAIKKCCNGIDNVEIEQKNGEINVKASHHDGTNHFTIHKLNARGKNINKDNWLAMDADNIDKYFCKIYGYIL